MSTRLRVATHRDVPQIGKLLALSFSQEELHAYLFPHQRQYPSDYVRTWTYAVRERWWSYDRIFIVAESDSSIVGVAEWQRSGIGCRGLWGGARWSPLHIISRLYRWYHRLHRLLHPDRSARLPSLSDPDPLSKANFGQPISPFVTTLCPSSPAHWELCTLGVYPDARSQGYGRRLVEWGLARARCEGIPAVVISAKDTEEFYLRCGFDVFLGRCSEVEIEGRKNPLGARGLGGGAVFVTEVWS